MNYYLMFEKFEKDESSFSVQEPWGEVLEYYNPQPKILKKKATTSVDDCYSGRFMSDFLKVAIGMVASHKVQQVFFDHGFTGFQFVPVAVECDEHHLDYAFINVTAHYNLLDPIASEAEGFSDILGGYKRVIEEVLDSEKFNASDIQHDCFTLSTYKDPYYVSERVKDALEAADVTGIEFIPMEFA